MEPATSDPSLLTDTATSDTTGSVGTVAGAETIVSVIGAVELLVVGTVVSVEPLVFDSGTVIYYSKQII